MKRQVNVHTGKMITEKGMKKGKGLKEKEKIQKVKRALQKGETVQLH